MEYGLIGEHLGHSYSKLIQEKLLEDYTYDLHPIDKKDLDAFMKKKAFKAINVTIPYKKDVIPYLTELDHASKKIGAVNTIVNKEGKLYGFNTDYYGFNYMIEKHNVVIKNKKVLVLGNGGASQAIQAVIKDHDAKEMVVTDILLSEGVIDLETAYKEHKDIQVVVNTTPCGMYPHVDSSAVDLTKFSQCEAVFDCVYNPMDTKFTLQAKSLGIKVAVTGLEMLVGQAKRALEYFKDMEIEDSEIDRIYREILIETANLITTQSDSSILQELGQSLNKKIVYPKDLNKEAIENNQILVINQKDIELYYEKLVSNGFIISGETTKEIITEFKKAVNNF